MTVSPVARLRLAASCAMVLCMAVVAPVLAAEPGATAGAGGDPRSPGEGPGLVGDPGFALVVVLLVALLSVVGTLAYVRLTGPRSGGGRG